MENIRTLNEKCLYCETDNVMLLKSKFYDTLLCAECGIQERIYHLASFNSNNSIVVKPAVYNMGHKTDCKLKLNDGLVFGGQTDSWMPMEDWGRWTGEAKISVITVNLGEWIREAPVLYLGVRASNVNEERPINLRVHVEGREIGFIQKINPNDEEYEFQIPLRYVEKKLKIDFIFYVDRTTELSNDPSEKGVGVGISLFSLFDPSELRADANFQLIEDEVALKIGSKVVFSRKSNHSSEFADIRAANILTGQNFYSPEQFGIWFSEQQVRLNFKIFNVDSVVVVIVASPVVGQGVTIFVDDLKDQHRKFESNFETISTKVPHNSDVNVGGYRIVSIKFVFDDVINMPDIGSSDQRQISGGLSSLEIKAIS